jgi:hypothetical protein
MQGLRRVLVSNHPAPVKSHLSANPCLAAVINFSRVLPNFARPPDEGVRAYVAIAPNFS